MKSWQQMGLVVLVSWLSSVVPSHLLAQEFSSNTARIAAWNLAGFPAISDERLKEQVKALQILDAEVVALVEVNKVDILDRLQTKLTETGFPYAPPVIIDQPGVQQDIGVLFKQGVEATNPRLLDGSDLGMQGNRKALLVDMKVRKFDFLLIVVHLKAGRNRPEQQMRDLQADVIGQFIDQHLMAHPREDILVLGDFNMIPGQDVSNFHFLGGDDQLDFLSSWDLQERYSHISEIGRANLLDGFAITRTRTTEYIRGSLRVFPVHRAMGKSKTGISLAEFRRTVSDHLPFVATFRINKDQD
jgi:endonuclease/exonuclease/phosphatase family metal-dependent hydrolase